MKRAIFAVILVLTIAGLMYAATISESYGTHTSLTVTNINGLASSATAGWKSAVIDNRTTAALDYEVCVTVDLADTAPANDQAVYVYVARGYHDGANWLLDDSGTATAPDGTEGTYTIGAGGGNLKLVAVLKYTAQNQVVRKTFNIGPSLGYKIGDGFSLIVVNYTGAATAATGNSIYYKAIKASSV
jgi:hypothetical protein